MNYLYPLKNSLVGLILCYSASWPWNCNPVSSNKWWLKWPSLCPQPYLAPKPAFAKLLWKSTKALAFTMNNSWFHGCPHKNSDSISRYVIGFNYFSNFFSRIWKYFLGDPPPESSENELLGPFPPSSLAWAVRCMEFMEIFWSYL